MANQSKSKNTELLHWNPWSDFPTFENGPVEWLNNVLASGLKSEGFVPGGDLSESSDAYNLEIDLPGVEKGDITIDVNERRVSVSGTRASKERVGVLRRTTRTTGSFAYELTLPTPVDEQRVTASLADGVLKIKLPKAADAKGTHVEIS